MPTPCPPGRKSSRPALPVSGGRTSRFPALDGFLEGLRAKLAAGARVAFLDNRYVAGSSTPISRRDAEGNGYQQRQLADGTSHEVLKNFPTAGQMEKRLGRHGSDVRFTNYQYYWVATYRIMSGREDVTMNFIRCIVVAACAFFVGSAAAQELRIGLASEPTAMDPHYHNLSPNNSLLSHIFERLVGQDERQRMVPDLAESWKAIDATTWEFKLRRNVRFHDGTPFTADDVLFSFERAPNVEGSPSSFGIYARGKTLHQGRRPHDPHQDRGALPADAERPLARSTSSRSKHGQGAKTPDYNSGKAAVGTGPYRFVEYTPGNRIVMQRNEQYWGQKPAWQRVTFRGIKSDPSRVAALLAGDVDFIDEVPATDMERLKKDPKLTMAQVVSNRIIYLHLDHFRDDSPFVQRARTASPIKNPLRDVRVRRAISMSIDRDAIVSRVMEGDGDQGRPAAARRLLRREPEAQAGGLRPERREEAARRGRRAERLSPHHPLAERPLPERRQDRRGGRADADRATASTRRW